MREGKRCSAVFDWSESDVGDRHADVATTLVLLKSAPVEVPNVLHRLSMLPGRGACRHLDGAATAVRTALRVFEDEIAQHARRGGCGRPARVVLPELGGSDAQARR